MFTQQATNAGTATSPTGPGKVYNKKILPFDAVCYLFVVHSIVDLTRSMQKEALEKHCWNLRDYVENKEGTLILAECVDYAGECPRCVKNAMPVYFKLEAKTGLYVEAPELYEPLWNPESRKLQEMLAAGASLQVRYEQSVKQRRGKETGKRPRWGAPANPGPSLDGQGSFGDFI